MIWRVAILPRSSIGVYFYLLLEWPSKSYIKSFTEQSVANETDSQRRCWFRSQILINHFYSQGQYIVRTLYKGSTWCDLLGSVKKSLELSWYQLLQLNSKSNTNSKVTLWSLKCLIIGLAMLMDEGKKVNVGKWSVIGI